MVRCTSTTEVVLTAAVGFRNGCVILELNLCIDFTVNHNFFGREGADLWVEGQSLGVIGVNNGWVRLKDDALTRRLKRSSTHSHEQVHHLRGVSCFLLYIDLMLLSTNFSCTMTSMKNTCKVQIIRNEDHRSPQKFFFWWSKNKSLQEENTNYINCNIYISVVLLSPLLRWLLPLQLRTSHPECRRRTHTAPWCTQLAVWAHMHAEKEGWKFTYINVPDVFRSCATVENPLAGS